MPGPLSAAGAVSEPSEFATLTQDRHFTGLWTQRSPFRDADVPWVYSKFYQAARFDSMIDGLNREITASLTSRRRPGISNFNFLDHPNYAGIHSFYSFKLVQNMQAAIRIIVDCMDGNIYDATVPGSRTTVFSKTGGASAQKARFFGIPGGRSGVNPQPYGTLFFANGTDLKKVVYDSGGWESVFDWQTVAPTNPPTLVGTGTGTLYYYAYAYKNKNGDGSVSSGSPIAVASVTLGTTTVTVSGARSTDPQIDTVQIFRGVQNSQSPLLLLTEIANPGSGTWSYNDVHTPDTSLNPFILCPENGAGNPPLPGMTAPEYHCGRFFAIVGNLVVYSGGPDTTNGNGLTAWPPLNVIPLPEQGIRLFSGITTRGHTLFVWTPTNVYAIFGDGTSSNRFTPAVPYMRGAGILNYDAVTIVGNTFYAYTSQFKVISFDPGAGQLDVGFPIADQFIQLNTGDVPAAFGLFFDPVSTTVTWHSGYGRPGFTGVAGASDTALYVVGGPFSDGSGDTSGVWFRMTPVAAPETGLQWSPLSKIANSASAMQSIEVAPGQFKLLIGPPVGVINTRPIGFRDNEAKKDFGAAYPSWEVLGNIVLCESGEIAEIAHIALKSAAAGARPKVALLLGEIKATSTAPWDNLAITSTDPPILPPPQSYYSDRYSAMQNGVCPKCDNFQLKIDYGAQDAADELLTFSVYGAKYKERRNQ
jgi:hypothetical protein